MRIGIALLIALVATIAMLQTAMAATYNISITNVTADINFSKDYGGVTEGNTLTISLYLPCTLEQINSTGGADYLNITADSATASTTVNVSVNSVSVLSSQTITGGSTYQLTFADMAAAGVDMSAKVLSIRIDVGANNTTSTLLVMNANDALLSANYSYSVAETLLTTPYVDTEAYAVRDNVSITQDSDVNLTDVNATLSYPSFTLSTDIPSYYNFGTLNTSETKYTEVSYQKDAPYTAEKSYSESTTTNKVTVTIKIYANENVTANFDLDTSSKAWKNYFPSFSKSNIESIKLNGAKVTWTDPSGVIKMSSLNLNEGYNTLTITYSKAAAAAPAAPVIVATPTPAIWEQTDPIVGIQ